MINFNLFKFFKKKKNDNNEWYPWKTNQSNYYIRQKIGTQFLAIGLFLLQIFVQIILQMIIGWFAIILLKSIFSTQFVLKKEYTYFDYWKIGFLINMIMVFSNQINFSNKEKGE